MDILPDARRRADEFVDNESQFQLGFLPTEQSHPLTVDFQAAAGRDTKAGITQLLAVDRTMASLAGRLLRSETMAALRASIRRVLESEGRVIFAGCGASGRMSVQLEAMWRRSFRELAERFPQARDRLLALADRAASVISGGELAVIQSVEYFEDHESFGRRQVLDAGVGPGDLFITLGEAGIAWSTIGMTMEADERGAETYFMYCNPRPLLEERLERCRRLFARKSIRLIEAAFGPMALTGSTRMQATSLELLCIGHACEWAIASWAHETARLDLPAPPAPAGFAHSVERLVAELASDDAVEALARAVEIETEVYRRGGLVTYYTGRFLIDILADTTERTPTFALPPFPRSDRPSAEPSWAFAKDPFHSTPDAWQELLERSPVGIAWNAEIYRSLGAPPALIEAPPQLGGSACYAYAIGNEPDSSRLRRRPSVGIWVDVARGLAPEPKPLMPPAHDESFRLRIGGHEDAGEDLTVPLGLTPGLLDLAGHLAVKLVFNTISTTTAARLGRIEGNWMIRVLPTNKKLIDRSIRIVAELKRLPYREAAALLFDTWARMPLPWSTTESPVAAALAR